MGYRYLSRLVSSMFLLLELWWFFNIWLVVWNMNFIFHNLWDNPSHWRSYFSRLLKPPTRYLCRFFFWNLIICFWWMASWFILFQLPSGIFSQCHAIHFVASATHGISWILEGARASQKIPWIWLVYPRNVSWIIIGVSLDEKPDNIAYSPQFLQLWISYLYIYIS